MIGDRERTCILFDGYEKRIINFCIIYVFLATIVAVELLSIGGLDFSIRLNVWIRVVYLYMNPMVYIKLIRLFREENHFDDVNYYNIQRQGEDRLKYAKERPVYKDVLVTVFVVVLTAFIIVAVSNIGLARCICTYEKMRQEILSEEPVGIIVGIYGFIIAIFQMMKDNLDKKCMFFDVDELPKVKNAEKSIAFSIVIIILYIFFKFILDSQQWNMKWLYLGEIAWWICFFMILWSCAYMFYKQVDVEKRVLNKIDRYYGTRKVLRLPQRIWYRGTAINKLTDLLNRYNRIAKKIDINRIEHIDFACVLTDEHDNRKRAIQKYYIVAATYLVLGSVMAIGLAQVLNERSKYVYICVMLLGMLPVIVLCFEWQKLYENFKLINYMTYISKWGYYIKLKNRKKEICIFRLNSALFPKNQSI